MKKPRILFVISLSFAVRYLWRTGFLLRIKDFCEPVVLIKWRQPDLLKELEDADIKCIVFEKTVFNIETDRIKHKIFEFFKFKLTSNPFFKSLILAEFRRKTSVKFKLYYLLRLLKNRYCFSSKRYLNLIHNFNRSVEMSDNFVLGEDILRKFEINGIFTLTPYLDLDNLFCIVGKRKQLPLFYSVLSFDNITGREFIEFEFSYAYVWNEINREELKRVMGEMVRDAKVVGVPQFDFYFNRNEYVMDVCDWKREKGVDLDRKVILYGANSSYLVPNERLFIQALDNAIASGRILGNPVILVRPHPVDSFVYWEDFVKGTSNVILEKAIENNQSLDGKSNYYSNFTRADIVRLTSALCHSDVHISIASTMALDGMAFDKPIICPYFSPTENLVETRIIKGYYWSDHYKQITESGAIHLARSYDELIEFVNDCLLSPCNKTSERAKLIKKLITPDKLSGTDRLVAAFYDDLKSELLLK